MGAFWCVFDNGRSGCVEADDFTAAQVAARVAGLGTVKDIKVLPYPAEPRLITKTYENPSGTRYTIPSFCYTPRECCGKTCCPKRRSCDE